ncbi:hypothetical protein F5877DRAFT_92676 [Lentinula edodes]|nr:hypothetical protein F5877DRAFT_92676 [Lentinula edodes]
MGPKGLEYELTVRQEPKQARMCGVGGKGSLRCSLVSDRRPIDPPPIVQLRVVDPLQRSNSSSNPGGHPQHGNEDAGFFVFPDLSVRTEGSYRLKLSLYEVVGQKVPRDGR